MPSAPAYPRGIRSFVLRAGRTTTAQQQALDALGPRYCVPFQSAMLDLDAVFGRTAPKVLEIGFGMGEATAKLAAAHRDRDYLGVEVHPPGVGALLRLIEQDALTNIRIVQHDAVEVLQQMIAPGSLDAIHVFFPDPWPKKRHHKRRLIQPPFVALLATALKSGGTLHLATDWQQYAQHMLEVLSVEPALVNTAQGFAERPASRPATKFEQRGLRLGHGVWDVLFKKVSTAR